MKTALITHADCLAHQVPDDNPEKPERLRRVLAAMEGPDFAGLIRLEAPLADDRDILRVHDRQMWADMAGKEPATPGEFHEITYDTFLHTGALTAARRAAGAGLRGAKGVFDGEFEAAFCAVRPPGHHAEPRQMMGFCFAGSAAITAMWAVEEGHARRAAVIDFDVHHGNGTQAAFWSRPELFFGSIHKAPLYPNTGHPHERGEHDNIRNAPFGAGISAQAWRDLAEESLLGPLDAFAPDLLVISAGFDAHRDDPLGAGPVTEEDFAWITGRLVDIARRHGQGRLVSLMEGGYDLDALARSAAAHVRALLDA